MNPIKKMFQFYNDQRVECIRKAFEEQLRIERVRFEKMNQALNTSFDERLKLKDSYFESMMTKVRQQEKDTYNKTLNALENEVDRLKKVIDGNSSLYFALVGKERELHRVAEELGDDLAVAIKKCEEAIDCTRKALGKAERFSVDYLGNRKKFLRLERLGA